MAVVSYSEQLRPRWEDFCRHSTDAWFWHTREWFDYAAAILGTRLRTDASFALLDGGELVAVAPAMAIAAEQGRLELGLGDQPLPWPAFAYAEGDPKRVALEKAVFEEHERRGRDLGARRINTFSVVPARAFFRAPDRPGNVPLSYGYSGVELETRVIDLTLGEVELWQQVRKGHRAAIRAGQRKLALRTWCGAIEEAEFDAYRELHALAAGRVTRSRATFDAMRDWIRAGNGLLVGAQAGQRWVGFAYFILFNQAAFYASACNDPAAAASTSIGHPLIWEAILACRRRGIELLEMGMQTDEAPAADPKLVSISLFKRGFGGFVLPRYHATLELAPQVSVA